MSGKGGKSRRYPGVRGPRPDQKERRQREAKERQAQYDALSLQEKLDRVIDFCRVTRTAAAKQRARLELALAKSGVAIEVVSASPKKAKRIKAKDRRAAEGKGDAPSVE